MWHKTLDSIKGLCYEDFPRRCVFHEKGTKHALQSAIAVGVYDGNVHPDLLRSGLRSERGIIESE